MKAVPTDLQVLNTIWAEYLDTFNQRDPTSPGSIFVAIDMDLIAKKLGVDTDIVFSRLHHHLNHKYGYTPEGGSKVALYARKLGDREDCVNFPLMASVLADLQEQARRYSVAVWIAVASFAVSVIAVAVSAAT